MTDVATMLGSLMQSFPGMEELLNVAVVLLGILLSGTAILKLVELGRLGPLSRTRWVTPIMYLVAGVALFNFPASIDTFLQTVYGPSSSVHHLLGYSSASKLPQKSKLMLQALLACLQLYGYVTFARGWLSVRRIGNGQNGSDEVFKTAMIRLCAGIGLINILETVNVVANTVGFGNVF